MPRYSEERKQAVLSKLLPPLNMTVAEVSRVEGIAISTDGIHYEVVRTLNPYVDPNDLDRAAKPFSSAGYNRMPVWADEAVISEPAF